MEIFWEVWQQSQINEARNAAERGAIRNATQIHQAETNLERRLDSIVLAQAAMWAIMKERLGLTDKDLLDRMEEIDAADGKRDGRMTAAPLACPKCARANARHRERCIFCGAMLGAVVPSRDWT